MTEALSFSGIIERYRESVSDVSRKEMQQLFDDDTHTWADAVISSHMREYGICPEHKSELWEVAKKVNRDILTGVESAVFSAPNFMEFYFVYLHDSLLMGYFTNTPRLADIIRKNVKWKVLTNQVLDSLSGDRLRNVAGRRIQKKSYKPPIYDAWSSAMEEGWPETMMLLDRIQNDEGRTENDEKELPGNIAEVMRDAGSGKIDMAVRKSTWGEVENKLRKLIDGEWNYENKPFEMPREKTRKFFRTTLNWFLVNYLVQSDEFRIKSGEIIRDLKVKEKYNVSIGAIDEVCLPGLMESFENHGPDNYYSDKNTGIRGRNLGVLFDKIANLMYNRLLFPELSQYGPGEWGIER